MRGVLPQPHEAEHPMRCWAAASHYKLCAARHALCRLSRYLTEHMDKISLGAMARLAGTNDAAMALLPLLERPPWVRRCGGGALLCAVCRQLQGRSV